MIHIISTPLSLLLAAASVFAYNSPPSGAITVGNGGKYSTLSAALADTSSSVFFIYSGTYTGQTLIERDNIKIYGQTATAGSYTGNTVTLTNRFAASVAGSNDASGTVRVHGQNVALYNLNIANTYGTDGTGGQAIALSVQDTYFGAYGLKLVGYQDTLLANEGYEYFSNCWIEGATDFIFGQRASLWITKSIINTVGNGWVTASGRSSDDEHYYVITDSEVKGSGKTYLGRPWRNYARVIFQNTCLHSHVYPAGWSAWSTSSPQTDHVTFAEYNNDCLGAEGTRASFATKLSSPIALKTVIPSTSWIDSAFL